MAQVPGIKEVTFMKEPKVLISILNWNNIEATTACIQSVLNQEYSSYKILLSDNASVVGSLEKVVKMFPKIELLRNNTNLGYAGAHKLAAMFAIKHEFDLFWILNNDTLVDAESLSSMVSQFKAKGNAIYGSLILESDAKTVRFGGGFSVTNNSIDFTGVWNPFHGKPLKEIKAEEIPGVVSDVNGSSMLIPVSIIEKYGFFPVDYFLYAEETYYCYKLFSKGIPSMMVPNSLVIHSGSQSFSNSQLKSVAIYYRRRNDLILRKHYNLITNKKILGETPILGFWIPFILKSILKKFGYQKISYKHYLMQLAVWHALINRKGKTIAPENFIHV